MAKPIKVEILGDAKGFTQALDTVGSGLGNLAAMAGTAGLALGALAVGGVVAVTKGLADLGAKFDDVYDGIRVGTGATGDALEGLQDSFRNVAATSYSSFEDIGVAIADLNTRLGLTGKPLEDLVTQFTNLSRITDTDLATNIDNITRVFGDWGVSVKDQSKVLDELYRTSQASGISLDDLSTKMVQFGAPLRNIGFSMQETEALFALWNKTGVNTETVMSGLRIATAKFAGDGKDASKEIQAVIDRITKLGPSAEATSLAMEVFGKKAGNDVADTITGGKFAIQDMLDTITNGTDTINQASEDTADWAEQWQNIKNRVFLALEPVATRVFTAIGDGLDRFVAPAFGRAQEGIKAFQEAWIRNDGTVTQSGFNGFMEHLANVTHDLWDGMKNLGATLQEMGEKVWPTVQDALRGTVIWFEQMFGWVRDSDFLMRGLKVTILGLVVAIAGLAAIVASLGIAFGTVVGAVVIAVAAIVSAIAGVFLYIKNHYQEWVDTIKAPFREGLGWVERKWNETKSLFTNPFGALGGALSGGRAYGGTISTAGMYRINERSTPGGETVFLPAGARVQPNYAGGGGRGGDVFNIYAPNAGPAEVAREIAWRRRMGDGR